MQAEKGMHLSVDPLVGSVVVRIVFFSHGVFTSSCAIVWLLRHTNHVI